ncbi:hypothetical protein [Halorubellus sp. PRR65]|uniref:hypothetical protein n=1 Tax=Halorubellus sp. PRR65 TaxID=3098148 RepID=UPI002B262A11|nr:hypothetical protein [Halorubellus sp. PRR65]
MSGPVRVLLVPAADEPMLDIGHATAERGTEFGLAIVRDVARERGGPSLSARATSTANGAPKPPGRLCIDDTVRHDCRRPRMTRGSHA